MPMILGVLLRNSSNHDPESMLSTMYIILNLYYGSLKLTPLQQLSDLGRR